MAQVNLIDQLGGVELKSKYSDKAEKAVKDEDGNNIKSTYFKIPQTGTPIVGLASPAAQGGYDAPTNVMIVDSLPSTRDPTTIYLLKENTNAS